MFSVSASPYNSFANSLYGGWTPSASASSMDSKALQTFYGLPANAATMYQDSKWANIIQRFSQDGRKRLLAKKIKEATKDMLKTWRTNAAWKKGYNDALKAMRSPYRRSPLSDVKRAAIVQEFEALPTNVSDPASLAWMSALSRVPFVANPHLPGVSAAGNELLWSSPDYLLGSSFDPLIARTDPRVDRIAGFSPPSAKDLNRATLEAMYPPALRPALKTLTDADLIAKAIADGYITA